MSYAKLINEKVVERIVGLLKFLPSKIGEESVQLPIARRAEDFPFMISQFGLVPAITFFLSKIEKNTQNVFVYGLNYFSNKTIDESKDNEKIRLLSHDAVFPEGRGYASYLAIVLVWPLGEIIENIENIKDLSGSSLAKEADPHKYLLKKVGMIEGYATKIEIMSMPRLLELKKITRALV